MHEQGDKLYIHKCLTILCPESTYDNMCLIVTSSTTMVGLELKAIALARKEL